MGEATEGMLGALRKGGGTVEAGRTWYAEASWRKEKSFRRGGEARGGARWGLVRRERGAGDAGWRAGDCMREPVEGAFWDEMAARGLQAESVSLEGQDAVVMRAGRTRRRRQAGPLWSGGGWRLRVILSSVTAGVHAYTRGRDGQAAGNREHAPRLRSSVLLMRPCDMVE